MIKEWFNWINASIGLLALLLLIAGFVILLSQPETIPVLDTPTIKSALPESAFVQPKEAYDAIDEPVMHLMAGKISLQLPDLKSLLSYYGKNNRPDADPATTMLHLGFTGDKAPTSFLPNDPIYLLYDRKLTPPRYTFSPGNVETPLWLEVNSNANQGHIKVKLKDENGAIIQEPVGNAHFLLAEKPQSSLAPAVWDIGKIRVDGTLLARQKARWFGSDKFLERHGGPEFDFALDKQRIDFGEGAESYSVFINKDSVLIWDGSHWKAATPGAETLGKPLLVIKKIDEKLMNFELWDPEGKTKVILNLLKSNETAIPPNLMNGFQFLGAKTLSQFVFEVNKERVTLAPQDWLLFVDKGWKKLTTPEEIDAYVDRRTLGYLFVFDAVEKREDKQVMVGALFNRARSDVQNIEFVMQQTGTGMAPYTPRSDDGGRQKEAPAQGDPNLQGRAARTRAGAPDTSYLSEDGDSEASVKANLKKRKRNIAHDD